MYLEIKEGSFNDWSPSTIDQMQWDLLDDGSD